MSSSVFTPSGNELTADERKKLAEFDYVRFTLTDLNGIGRCKAIPKRHILSTLERGGVEIYAGVLAFGPRSSFHIMDEVQQINNGNVLLVPMTGTIRALPWATDGKYKVGEVLCETFWIKPFYNGSQQAACPRAVARRQIDRLAKLGYKILSGYEPEFMAFHKDSKEPIFKGNDIFSCRDLVEFESYMYDLDSGLNAAGADCAVLNTEYASGQFEFPMVPKYGLEAGDMMFRMKNVAKEISLKKDVDLTFMTQPVKQAFNNGLHFSHSIWELNGKKNVFFNDSKTNDKTSPESCMSDVLKRWLGGLLKHTPALVALSCPTVNCYRRVGAPFAPGAADWGINDRFKAYRVKVGVTDPMETYLENRIPSGAANSYLVLAATIAAGIAGLEDKDAKFPEANYSVPLPKTLEEALDALENDRVMVEALGEEFVKWFCITKRELEVKMMKEDNFEKEVEMYYKMF